MQMQKDSQRKMYVAHRQTHTETADELYRKDIKGIKRLSENEYTTITNIIKQEKIVKEELSEHPMSELDRIRLQSISEQADEARATLVERNLPFVLHVAGTFADKGVSFEDLTQEGNLALLEAAQTFDPDKGKFLTYAGTAIKRRLYEKIQSNHWGVMTPSAYTRQTYERMMQCINEFQEQGISDINVDMLSSASKLSPIQLQRLTRYWTQNQTVSWEQPMQEESDNLFSKKEFGNEMVADPEEDGLLAIENMSVRKTVKRIMHEILSPVEEICLTLLYGLEDGVERTLGVVGEELGYSTASIIQIRRRALENMHSSDAKRMLHELLLK